MSLINEIYSGAHFDLESNKASHKMGLEVHKIVNQFEHMDKKDMQKIEDLFFEASSCGQDYGFWSGFRFAVQLMAECFI